MNRREAFLSRNAQTTTAVLCVTIPISRSLNTRYGPSCSWRFLIGAGTSLAIQHVLVGLGLIRVNRNDVYQLRCVDSLTLSRGGAAALLVGVIASGVRDRTGYAGWLSWVALLYGCTVCDWLDGPIARTMGTSDLGEVLDLETDSWLTLCAAASATAWGELPRAVVAPPILRYVVLLWHARQTSQEPTIDALQQWDRVLGVGQMLLVVAALSPFRGRWTSAIVQAIAPIEIGVQIVAFGIRHLRPT